MNTLDLALEERRNKLKLEWDTIESWVLKFQKQFENTSTQEDKEKAEECCALLLNKFSPMFLKYIQVIKYKVIDWTDKDTKEFIALFIEAEDLRRALRRKKINAERRNEAYDKFNFVVKTYGTNTEEDIMSDLHMCFITLAKRYKNVGKNFCTYVKNVFKHEVGRHIKRWIKDPLGILYKNSSFEDWKKAIDMEKSIIEVIDNRYEVITGLPDSNWINGSTCSPSFKSLSTFQRNILVKYYLEGWTDKQISKHFGANINTINHNRRKAIIDLCSTYDFNFDTIKRTRNSGLKANLPIF